MLDIAEYDLMIMMRYFYRYPTNDELCNDEKFSKYRYLVERASHESIFITGMRKSSCASS